MGNRLIYTISAFTLIKANKSKHTHTMSIHLHTHTRTDSLGCIQIDSISGILFQRDRSFHASASTTALNTHNYYILNKVGLLHIK